MAHPSVSKPLGRHEENNDGTACSFSIALSLPLSFVFDIALDFVSNEGISQGVVGRF